MSTRRSLVVVPGCLACVVAFAGNAWAADPPTAAPAPVAPSGVAAPAAPAPTTAAPGTSTPALVSVAESKPTEPPALLPPIAPPPQAAPPPPPGPPPPPAAHHQQPRPFPRPEFYQEHFGNPVLARDSEPLAGYHGGKFYLRDRNDKFRLYLGGQLAVDWLNYPSSGASDAGLNSTLIVRRARLELAGELLNWNFMFGAEMSSAPLSNALGQEQTSASAAGTTPGAGTATYAPVQGPSYSAKVADAYINYRAAGIFNIQAGQFQVPFSMENRTADDLTPFMERSLPVRLLGAPSERDLRHHGVGSNSRKCLLLQRRRVQRRRLRANQCRQPRRRDGASVYPVHLPLAIAL